jgi:hypothetical protein
MGKMKQLYQDLKEKENDCYTIVDELIDVFPIDLVLKKLIKLQEELLNE